MGQQAIVYVQAGDYKNAKKCSSLAISEFRRLRIVEFSAPVIPLHVEASLGSKWAIDSNKIAASEKPYGLSFLATLAGRFFPNIRPHAYRVSGRLAAAKGRKKKALKYFNKAIAGAQNIGAEYEQARSLIDKSMLEYPDAIKDRQRGLQMLESLGCVLPEAEVEYLGTDREEHHARAAAALENENSDPK